MTVYPTLRKRPLFSQRLALSRCPVCGPGMGMMARDIRGRKDQTRLHVVPVLCRACGGHSPTFVEESADA